MAELEGFGPVFARPLCSCHGLPMVPNGRPLRKDGTRGRGWRCPVRDTERLRRQEDSPRRRYHHMKKALRRRIRDTEIRIAELEDTLASSLRD